MKTLFSVLMLLIPLQAVADIYKCRDDRNVLVYQDTPCKTKMIGKVNTVPSPSKSDELRARQDLDRLIQDNRYHEQKRQAEWEKEQERLHQLEALEIQERARLAAEAERYAPSLYIPAYGPDYRYRRHHHPNRPLVPVMPARQSPCVIGYIGDRGCR